MAIKGDSANLGLYLSGQEVPIDGANMFITQPSIKQIVTFGEDTFLIGLNLLIHTENLTKQLKEGNSELSMYSDFQLLMIVLREDRSVRLLIQDLFELIFPNYNIQIDDGVINFIFQENEEEQGMLVGQVHPYNFDNFRNILEDLFEPQKTEEEELLDYNPANEQAAAIAAKLKKGREKVRELKGDMGKSLFANYCSVLAIGMNMDVNIFYNYTPFQLYDAYRRFFEKQKYDFYTRVSTMPFMDVSKMDQPKEWTRNLY